MDEATTRELIRDAAAQMRVQAPDPDQLIARANAKRRRSWFAFGAAAAIVVVLAATATVGRLLTPHPNGDPEQSPGSRHTAPSSKTSPQSLADWLDSLPSGAPPRLPYLSDRTVINGSVHVPQMEYPNYRFLGAAPGGLLVQEMRHVGYSFRYGIFHDDRRITWMTGWLADPLEVTSSDHQRLAVESDGSIQMFDLNAEDVIGTYHSPTAYVGLISLSTQGVVFNTGETDGTGGVDLWTPGSALRHLPFAPTATSDDLRTSLVVVQGSPCVDAVRVTAERPLVVYHGCGDARPLSLSPDGRHAVTRDLQLVDLLTGSLQPVTNTNGDPRPGDARTVWRDHQIAWEDSHHVLIRLVTRGSQGSSAPTALIRCSTDGVCERAPSDINHGSQSGYDDLALLDPTTTPYG